MKRILRTVCVGVAGLAVLLGGCAKQRIPEPTMPKAKNYYRELPPGAPALRRITDPRKIPDFRPAFSTDRADLMTALDHSIRYMKYPSSRRYFPVQDITHARAAESLAAFRALVDSSSSPEEFQMRLMEEFDVYESVGCDDEGAVLFTGYYTPVFDASLTRTGAYRWPLYKLPSDLVKGPEGETLGRRDEMGRLTPYYTRGEIESGALAGHELVYLKDRFEAYICTVQGSARLRLQDGSWYNVAYHGNNGKPYTSIGQALVRDGRIARDQLTLSGLMAYFAAHPEAMDIYLPRNERTVFFQRTDAPPTGSLGLPVTAYRSIATDKSLFPRGAVAFVDTRVPRLGSSGAPTQAPFKQFVLDQDTGGAIRAAGRCDIYLGIGDEAGRIAGWTLNEGKLYYLFVKE